MQLIILLLVLTNSTTYSGGEFSKDYHGQTYIDLDTLQICTTEDCSN